MDGYSFFADDDETLMPKGRVERRGGDHLTDFIPDEVGTFEPGLKDDELPEIRFPYEPQ